MWSGCRPRAGWAVAGSAVWLAAACGAANAVPRPSDVRAALSRHGIDLEALPEDGHGCVVMQPRASNSGAERTYGTFTIVIAREAKCNDDQATGDADSDHLYWSHTGTSWVAIEKLEENLWLRMRVTRHELGDRQHVLETAAFHAFDTRT